MLERFHVPEDIAIRIPQENMREALIDLFKKFRPTPQLLENITVSDKSIINSLKCKMEA